MLTFNNKKFARVKSEFDASCTGYYRRVNNGVHLMTPKKEPCGFVVMNPLDAAFLVTVFRTDAGRLRYMFGATKSTEEFLGVEKLDFAETRGVCDELRQQLAINV